MRTLPFFCMLFVQTVYSQADSTIKTTPVGKGNITMLGVNTSGGINNDGLSLLEGGTLIGWVWGWYTGLLYNNFDFSYGALWEGQRTRADVLLSTNDGQAFFFQNIPPPFTHSYFLTSSISLHLDAGYRLLEKKKNGQTSSFLRTSLGVKPGYRQFNGTRAENGNTSTITRYTQANTRWFNLDFTGKITYGFKPGNSKKFYYLSLFGNYSPISLFKAERGPSVHLYNVGVTFEFDGNILQEFIDSWK